MRETATDFGKKFWKLKLEEKNRCESRTGDKEKKNGKKS